MKNRGRRHRVAVKLVLLWVGLSVMITGCSGERSSAGGSSTDAGTSASVAVTSGTLSGRDFEAEQAELLRQRAIAWIKAEAPVAQHDEWRWQTAPSGALRRMEFIVPGGDVAPARPPWFLVDNRFYLQEFKGGTDSGELRWYELVPSMLVETARSSDESDKAAARRALERVLFMIWTDPLWAIANMSLDGDAVEVSDADGVFLGWEVEGDLPMPETYSKEIREAAMLVGVSGENLGYPSPENQLVRLTILAGGRLESISYDGPEGFVWRWFFYEDGGRVELPGKVEPWPSSR